MIKATIEQYLISLQHAVTEVRILRKSPYLKGQYVGQSISGYYEADAYTQIENDIAPYEADPGTTGIYTTLHDMNPDLLHRAKNKLRTALRDRDPTTSDEDITAFTVFPIDLDPPRPAGISASDDELAVAKEQMREIYDAIVTAGIPESAIAKAMSGNGWHLLIYINRLETTDANVAAFKQLGDAVAAHFGLDTVIYNPSRIWKLYGTTGRKGDNTDERPHRQSKVWLPESLDRVQFACLSEKLTAGLPVADVQSSQDVPKPSEAAAEGATPSSLRDWLDKHGIVYKEKAYKGTSKFIIDCPHNEGHKRDAWVTDEGGAWQFACSHNSCKNSGKNTWAAFKAAVLKTKGTEGNRAKKAKKPNPVKVAKDASGYFLNDTFNVLAMSDFIQNKFHVWSQDSGIYLYDEKTGVYRLGELDIDRAIRTELGVLRKKSYTEEVLADLRACCRREVPDSSHRIGFKNGVLTLNLEADGPIGEWAEHSHKNYLMSVFPVQYALDADFTDGAKDFQAWLLDVLDGDQGLVQVLYEVIGSIFHKGSVEMQRGVLLVGEGGTGKSMFLSQIERIIGRENIAARAWGDYGFNDFAFGDLYGKSLALDSDIDVSRPLSGSLKPAITGNLLTCNKKYQQPFDFNPFATWIGSINRFPKTKDKTWGFFRRWITIPFHRTFPTNSQFESTKRRLWSDEETKTSIVSNALVVYMQAYRKGAFTIPERAAVMAREMHQAANSVISWLDQWTAQGEGTTGRSEAYQSYADFCSVNGFEADTTRAFYATLRSQGYNVDARVRIDGKLVRAIDGLTLGNV